MTDDGQDYQEDQQQGGRGADHHDNGGASNDPVAQASAHKDMNAMKDPKDWKTGDEPATAAQMSYISTMAVEAHEEVPFELTKAEASERIEELQKKTGRTGDTLAPQ